jgi:energy-coupling factor transporter ATP-binding protein EcfA2
VLAELQLTNFKGFRRHTLPLRAVSVLVGRNNAGKSTVIEALRLIAIVAERYRGLAYFEPPAWTDLPLANRGVSPSLRGMEFNFETAIHGLEDGPALVVAKFVSGEKISLYIGSDAIHAVISDRRGRPITTKGQALQLSLPRLSIQPQVAPLVRDEVVLDPDYVRASMSSHLASSHFRNQLRLFPGEFTRWVDAVQEAWPSILIKELSDGRGLPGDAVTLLVRDGSFTGEVGWMGAGLQMWLQLMWYLTLARNDATVILDEPDVYMHPDLQRRLLRMLRGRHDQMIVATHSVEIISEARPREIVMVDRERSKSRFSTSVQAVQHVVDHLGGVQSLQLMRLWNAQRCVFIEGGDFRLLKLLHDTLEPGALQSLEEIPHMPIGGWGGWNQALGASTFLKNEAGQDIVTYCILDRDYHTKRQVAVRMDEATQRRVELKVWSRKEIENFLLVPEAIGRVIAETAKAKAVPSPDEVSAQIDTAIAEYRNHIEDELARELLPEQRQGLPAANRAAREQVSAAWKTREGRLSLAPGKLVFQATRRWAKESFGASFGPDDVAASLNVAEIHVEVAAALKAISAGAPFAT